MRIAVLTDIREIQTIEMAWLRLLDASTCVRPFHTPLWFEKACEVHNDSPRVFCAWDGTELVGVFPLCRYENWWQPGNLGFPWWPAWEAPDLIVREGDDRTAKEIVEAVYRSLPADGECALVNFHKDSNLLSGLKAFIESEDEDVNYILKARLPLPYIDLSQGWDSYLAAKSPNFKRTLRRTEKKINEHQLHLSLLAPGDPRIQEALRIHNERSSRKFGEKALHSADNAQRFLHDTVPELHRRGFFRCHVMEDRDSRTVACLFEAVRPPGALFAFIMGCDKELEGVGPGMYIVTRAAQVAAEEGTKLYGLGHWTSPFKERMQTGAALVYSLRLGGASISYDEKEQSL